MIGFALRDGSSQAITFWIVWIMVCFVILVACIVMIVNQVRR